MQSSHLAQRVLVNLIHIAGAALGIQIDGAKNFVQNEIPKQNRHQTLLIRAKSPKLMVQLHHLHHSNAAPEVKCWNSSRALQEMTK